MAHPVWLPTEVGEREQAEFHSAALLAGQWYAANQNTYDEDETHESGIGASHAWGVVRHSADVGRYLYEYFPTRRWARGNGVWGQALGICALLGLAARTGRSVYGESAMLAASYLRSLQVWDPTQPDIHGGFREHTPQTSWGFPRDAATGAMGLVALYRETGNEEDLARAIAFADWFIPNALDPDGWPAWTYHFDTRKADFPAKEDQGVWQTGSALFYYQLYRITGEPRFLNDGAIPLVDRALEMLAPRVTDDSYRSASHDFALTAILGVYLATGERRYFDLVKDHLDAAIRCQAADGRLPGFPGGMSIFTMVAMDFVRIVQMKEMAIDVAPYVDACYRAARFLLTLQERDSRDPMAYGGFYGQSDYGLDRDRIHHRVTGYALVFNVRYEGHTDTPYFSALGW